MGEAKRRAAQYAEAFQLMWYACPCGHRERIWNSRDGVTPFGLRCPSCGSYSLRHIDWKLDTPAPNHKPLPGQRWFRDGTAAEAVAIVEQRIAATAKSRRPVPAEIQKRLIENARELKDEWRAGWSFIMREPD